jgi:hypothetical protein
MQLVAVRPEQHLDDAVQVAAANFREPAAPAGEQRVVARYSNGWET